MALRRIAAWLNLTDQELGAIVGVANCKSYIAALKSSEAASENAVLLIQLHSLLTDIVRDDAKAAPSWLKSYNVALGARRSSLCNRAQVSDGWSIIWRAAAAFRICVDKDQPTLGDRDLVSKRPTERRRIPSGLLTQPQAQCQSASACHPGCSLSNLPARVARDRQDPAPGQRSARYCPALLEGPLWMAPTLQELI